MTMKTRHLRMNIHSIILPPTDDEENTNEIDSQDLVAAPSALPASNVLSTKAWTEKTLCEIESEWQEWADGNSTMYIPSVVGSISSALLKAIAGQIGKKLLNHLYERLFPTPDPITMEQILEAVEQMLNQILSKEVRTRVHLELEGLQRNIVTFLEDVENFEKRIILDAEDDVIQPQAIIDSIQTLNQLFINRIPQFRNPDYKALLLPLYVQAANLHIGFLKDVVDNASEWGLNAKQKQEFTKRFLDAIKEYSNYFISTYQEDFQKQFTKKIQYVLKYRNFMILNVLDFVSLWPMLRFDKLIIKTSSYLYESGQQTEVNIDPTYPYSSWANLNRIFQGFLNKELQSVTARNFNAEVSIAGNPVSLYTRHLTMGNLKSSYSGGKSVQMGYGEGGGCPSSPGVKYCEKYTVTASNMSRGLTHANVGHNYSSSGGSSHMRVIDTHTVKFSDKTMSDVSTLLDIGHSNWINYPEYKIRNIIGLPPFLQANATNLIDGPQSQYRPNDSGTLRTVVTSFQRRDHDPYTSYDGGIRHTMHFGYGFDAVTVSPLEYFSTYNVSDKAGFLSLERHGNNGDRIVIPAARESHHGFIYTLYNPYDTDYKVDIYLKYAAPQQTRIGLYLNGWGTTPTVHTQTNNDGIEDMGPATKIQKILSDFTLPKESNSALLLENYQGANPLYVDSIIITKAGVTPISI
uniref:Crystaline entomocidal protoxin n=1 Tax=Bacillus thuringiensis TaxID=1428 RepID=A0A0K0K248_BACTU|nr:cry2Ac-like protein [Bacillus thuringiensis]